MRRWIKHALTRTLTVKGPRGSVKHIEVEPSQKLIYGIYFAIIALIALIALQIVHIIILKEPNREVLSTITLLIGTIIGVFFGKKT